MHPVGRLEPFQRRWDIAPLRVDLRILVRRAVAVGSPDCRKRRVSVGLPIELVVDDRQTKAIVPIQGWRGAGCPRGLELPQRQVRESPTCRDRTRMWIESQCPVERLNRFAIPARVVKNAAQGAM